MILNYFYCFFVYCLVPIEIISPKCRFLFCRRRAVTFRSFELSAGCDQYLYVASPALTEPFGFAVLSRGHFLLQASDTKNLF